ncbi:DUF3883 domain-containing protein [Lactobacillus rizhaonensis]|uniref:DUF3883 domain-containing protein n=1 Tax=Lactobacillus rizhaonensis TaxID=3082863 RepID=UPI0030C6E360|nr:DUF3883 domain-containing protein [Bifidobacteriales bacterium]
MRELAEFDYMLDSFDKDSENLNQLRCDFVNKYTLSYIKNRMKLDDFVVGKENKNSFCYELEFNLAQLGSIKGSSSKKFGIYYSQKENKYIITKAWERKNIEESFIEIKNAIIEIIKLGEKDGKDAIEKIDSIPLSSIFKYKILSVYYPNNYLNIFSKNPLLYFLFQFNPECNFQNNSIYEMQKKLIRIKNSNKIVKNWTNIEFGNYLFYLFPKVKHLNTSDNSNRQEQNNFTLQTPVNPDIYRYEYKKIYDNPVVIDVQTTKYSKPSKKVRSKSKKTKINYLVREQKNNRLGKIGEKIVYNFEVKNVKMFGNLKVKWQSKVDDSLGYDILSYEEDGSPRYIEVKTTEQKNNNEELNFFISHNELEKAKVLENYWIYQVYFTFDKQPVIKKLKDPFKKDKIKLQPTLYLAHFKIKNNNN